MGEAGHTNAHAYACGTAQTGFWTALVWSMFIFFVMKLAAHVIQQKVFGEGLGSYTSVLQMVAINSEMMKSSTPTRSSHPRLAE
jgi:hypothetical protein